MNDRSEFDRITTKVRRKIGRASAEARKLRGELPGFMRTGKTKAKPGKEPKR